MYLLVLLWTLLNLNEPIATVAVAVAAAPSCTAPESRAAIRAAVEQQLVLHGLPKDLEVFTFLDRLNDATSDQTRAMAAELQRQLPSLSGLTLKLCEVNDPKLDAPLFITIFVTGPGIPQPSGYVLNFGLPGAAATIGSPPQ